MSVRVLSAVLDYFLFGGTLKLVMLCLADHANDAGQNCYPSIAGLARRACCSESQARRHVHWLIDNAYVNVEHGTENGGARSRRYRIELDRLTPSTDATPSMDATPSTHAHDPLHGCAGPLAPMRGTPSTHDTRTVKKRHRTVNKPSKKKLVFPDWVPLDSWNAFEAMRREAKKPVTKPGRKMLLAKLTELKDAGHDPRQIIEAATVGNWSGFWPPQKAKAQAKDVGLGKIDYSQGLPK